MTRSTFRRARVRCSGTWNLNQMRSGRRKDEAVSEPGGRTSEPDENAVLIAGDATADVTDAIGACTDLFGVPASTAVTRTPVWPGSWLQPLEWSRNWCGEASTVAAWWQPCALVACDPPDAIAGE